MLEFDLDRSLNLPVLIVLSFADQLRRHLILLVETVGDVTPVKYALSRVRELDGALLLGKAHCGRELLLVCPDLVYRSLVLEKSHQL